MSFTGILLYLVRESRGSRGRLVFFTACVAIGVAAVVAVAGMAGAIEEDVAVFVTQQRGFRSRGFRGAHLSGQEKRIRRLHELIDDWIEMHATSD